jgi:hypothetical protein
MQSRMGPGSQYSRRLRAGHEMVRRHGPTRFHPAVETIVFLTSDFEHGVEPVAKDA